MFLVILDQSMSNQPVRMILPFSSQQLNIFKFGKKYVKLHKIC